MQDQEHGNQTSAMYSHVILSSWKEKFKGYREIEIYAPQSSRDFWRWIVSDPTTSEETFFHLLYCESKKTLMYINERTKVEFGYFQSQKIPTKSEHKKYIDWIAFENFKYVSERALSCQAWADVYEVDTKVAITEIASFKKDVSESDPAFKNCEDLIEGISAGWFPVGYYSEYFHGTTYEDRNGITKNIPTHFGWVPKKQIIEAWAATKRVSEIITAHIQTERMT